MDTSTSRDIIPELMSGQHTPGVATIKPSGGERGRDTSEIMNALSMFIATISLPADLLLRSTSDRPDFPLYFD